MNKEEKIKRFDPNGLAIGDQLFGLPFSEEESEIIILPVPWEVTVSYSAGTANAPAAIAKASRQVDLFDDDVPEAWKRGIFIKKVNKEIRDLGKNLRSKAEKYLAALEERDNSADEKALRKNREAINAGGELLRSYVNKETTPLLQQGKLIGLLGGDHSTPLGFMEALAENYPEYGVLQIDAHCDLRNAYEGFVYSHASIMFNALKIPQITRLVQVGIRDYCHEEMNVIHESNGRIKTFLDADIKRLTYEGDTWKQICDRIIHQLPKHVYISFDIDGLDPKLCPHTGTPVPGGLEFEQTVYLILNVVKSGRKIIGFDLNEVVAGNDEWDANVAARLLYKLCNLMGESHRISTETVLTNEQEAPTNDEEVYTQAMLKEVGEQGQGHEFANQL